MKTPAYFMNDSVTMGQCIDAVRGYTPKHTFYTFTSCIGSPMITLTIADSENGNYAQAIQDGIDFLVNETRQIEPYAVVSYEYNQRMNMSTYFIMPDK